MGFQSKISVKIYDLVAKRRRKTGIYQDVVDKLLKHIKTGRLVDMGTGTGLLLADLYLKNQKIELYGFDSSQQMCKQAEKNLEREEIPALIVCGTVLDSIFDDEFFDLMTCTASFSFWDDQVKSLNKMYKMLRPGGKIIMFEPHKDADISTLSESIKEELKESNWLRRYISVRTNKTILKTGDMVGMNLLSVEEFEKLIKKTRFKQSFSIEENPIAGFPAFVQIILEKEK